MRFLFLFCLLLCRLALADAFFNDGDFSPKNWTDFVLAVDDPRIDETAPANGTGLVTLSTTGGNLGNYRLSEHNLVGGENLYTGGISTSAVYSPATDGSIENITIRADVIEFNFRSETAFQLVVRQGGINYYSTISVGFGDDSWQPLAIENLSSNDFDTDPNVGALGGNSTSQKPDFSRNGSPIQFGYAFGNGVDGLGARFSNRVGIDNWQVEITTRPFEVLSSYINQGSAQRSMIQGIGLIFDSDVSSKLKAGYLKVRNITTGITFDLSAATLVFDPRNFSATWMLDKNVSALLPDGNYIAWLESDQLLNSNEITRIPVDDYTFGFYQMTGDGDGDRDVDFLDAAYLRDAWHQSSSQNKYKSYFDFNLNNSVEENDRLKIEPNYFKVLQEVSALHLSLRNDTGDSSSDNLTNNYAIAVGLVNASKIVRLAAKIDDSALQDITDTIVSSSKAILSTSIIDQINQNTLSFGAHTIIVNALDKGGLIIASDTLTFNYSDTIPSGVISGKIYQAETDTGSSEQILSDRIIFIDTNDNGTRDSNEPFTISGKDGKYSFYQLRAGQYKVRQELPIDWHQTFPASVATGGGDGFADYIANYFSTGNAPYPEPYGRPFGGNINQSVDPKDIVLGPNPDGSLNAEIGPVDFLSIPQGSSVTVGFSDELIIDGPGDDIFIQTILDHANEHANIYVGTTLNNLVFIKQIGEGGSAGLDLATINFQGPVSLVKVEGVDNLGGAPGFDLVSIHALSRSNVENAFQFVDLSTNSSQKTDVNFGSFGVDAPPQLGISITSPQVNKGDTYSIRLTARDDVGIQNVALFINGISVPLTSSFTYTGTASSTGVLSFDATATDVKGQSTSAQTSIFVNDPNNPDTPGNGSLTGPGGPVGSGNGTAPIVTITAPNSPSDDLSKIFGSVNPNSGTLNNWTLSYAPQSSINLNNLADPSVTWTQVASGTTEQNTALLGTLNLASLSNVTYVFRLLAYNTGGLGAVTSVIYNPVDTAVPTVVINSPLPGADLSYLTPIRCTVQPNGGTLHNWALEYAPASQVNLENLGEGTAWKPLANGTTAQSNAVLATFDPTMLRNDGYVIRLLAYNTNGRGYAIGNPINVIGDAKLGNFKLDFIDLTIQLQGIPIQVRRSYDTLNSTQSSDFGYGWALSLSDADLRETVPDTGNGFTATPFKVGTRVFITNPEGKRVGFTFKTRNPQSSFFFTTYEPYFEADPGVYDTLTLGPADNTRISVNGSGNVTLPLFGFAWNPDDYVLTTKDGIKYHYNHQSGLQDITDLSGNKATFTTNAITHSSGEAIKIVRNTQGRITQIIDPDNKSLLYAYNSSGDLISFTDRASLKTTFSYLTSPSHYLKDVTDPLGRLAQRTEYGPDGRIVAVTDALGNRVAQNFDPANFRGTVTNARGNITTLIYNARGNLLEEHKPEGGITKYEYSDTANPDKETAKIDPLGHRTESTYDAKGNKLTEKDALGMITEFAYNDLNKVVFLKRKSATNVVLSSEAATYDAQGHLLTLTNAMGATRNFLYDPAGLLILSTDFTGNTTNYDHTNGCGCGAPGKITYADGKTKTFEYNRYGQKLKETDETGAVTTYTYDANGRQTSVIDPDNMATTFTYDANGNQTKRVDRLGRTTKYEYDAKNHLVKEIKILTDDSNDANDVIITYEYDGDDHLTALVDPVGNRTSFAFDRDGRLQTRTDAAGAATTVHYDLAGNTQDVIDRNGRKRSFLYDARNQPTTERWHDSSNVIIRTIAIAYDTLGRRTSIADPDSAYTYQYDAASRVTQVSNAGTPNLPVVILNYGYDADGHTTSVIDNTGVSVKTTFDNRGLSDHFIWSGGGISPASVNLERNGRGQVTAIDRYSNATLSNLVSRTTYDQIASQGWVKQIQHRKANGQLYNAGTNFTYGYNAEGEVVSQSSQGNSTSFSYDPTGQLLTATHTDPAYSDETYTYDKAGNRTSSYLSNTYTIGTANRLLNDGKFKYAYDTEGNTITKTEIATGKVTQFAYDHRGRLTSLTDRVSVGGAIVSNQSFIYDAVNRRISININGILTKIVYNKDNAWSDYSEAGAVVARYLFGNRIDLNVAKWTSTSGTQWFLTDNLDSIRGLTDSTGTAQSFAAYNSFGQRIEGASRGNLLLERYGYAGREDRSGLIYYRSRFLDTSLGRFTTEDPIGFGGHDWELYRFGFNSPYSGTDPYGTSFIETALVSIKDASLSAQLRIIGFLAEYSFICAAVRIDTTLNKLGVDVPSYVGSYLDSAARSGVPGEIIAGVKALLETVCSAVPGGSKQEPPPANDNSIHQGPRSNPVWQDTN